MTPLPTQSNILAALRSFLLAALPGGTRVVAGQGNRVPEPKDADFVVMTPIRFTRLRTNVDTTDDVRFMGSFAGAIMNVSAVSFGAIEVGATVYGVGVADGTKVKEFLSGTGGIGTYRVSVAQTIGGGILSSGATTLEQGAEVVVQLDFHSADLSTAGDMAQTVSTLFRDPFATAQFEDQSPNYGVVPLYADDPLQVPFFNAEQQTEFRWTLEAMLQANILVSVPQQYADVIVVDLLEIDATYPP